LTYDFEMKKPFDLDHLQRRYSASFLAEAIIRLTIDYRTNFISARFFRFTLPDSEAIL